MNLYLRLLGMVLATRRRGRLHLWDTARISFRVLPTDLDVLGHMTNSRYLALMDIGRLDMMRRSGAWAEVKRRRWYAVVAGQTIAYRKSLNPWQRVDLYTRNIGSDHRWNYLEQIFCVGTTVHAHAIVRTRFLRREGGSIDIDELAEALGEPPAHVALPEHIVRWGEDFVPLKEFDPAVD